MTWLIILKNFIAYQRSSKPRDKELHRNQRHVQSTFVVYVLSKNGFREKKIETARRKRMECTTHSTRRKYIPDILSQIANLTSNHSRVRVLGRIYWMPHSLNAFCVHLEDMMPTSYTSKIRANLLSSVTSLSSHSRRCTNDRWLLWVIDEAELVPMYAYVGGL